MFAKNLTTEGFYSIQYQGAAGTGFGQFTLDTGIIVGTDVAGVKYDGTYVYNTRTDCFDLDLSITVPADAWMVTGVPAQGREWKLQIKTSLPRDLGDEHPVCVDTGLGLVNVVIRKLRDFPG